MAFLPFSVVAVIVVVPAPLAVTFPPDTVATFLLLDDHVTVLVEPAESVYLSVTLSFLPI